ncbi:hypothetical protein GQ55_3G134100 [Panicum hallii var. hallii]|uniref:Uncharacterized protein n=1 Tax=Panicum hallii var. hallii TaxID=1504633 RepID=A0A2T7E902_9POAL|nr:hypothetical protein GQ55_3G134100 [Panicum hallii var. hallii]
MSARLTRASPRQKGEANNQARGGTGAAVAHMRCERYIGGWVPEMRLHLEAISLACRAARPHDEEMRQQPLRCRLPDSRQHSTMAWGPFIL